MYVRLDVATYFNHGKYKGYLSKNDAKQLNKVMSYVTPNHHGLTNWEYAVAVWNLTEATRKIENNVTQPDYSKLPTK